MSSFPHNFRDLDCIIFEHNDNVHSSAHFDDISSHGHSTQIHTPRINPSTHHLFASLSTSQSPESTKSIKIKPPNNTPSSPIVVLPVGIANGIHHRLQYIWTGSQLKALPIEDIHSIISEINQPSGNATPKSHTTVTHTSTPTSTSSSPEIDAKQHNTTKSHSLAIKTILKAHRSLQLLLSRCKYDIHTAFFPNPHEVTSDYWKYAQWRACHRLFSSMSSIFATQSLLLAVGVGAKRSLPAAASINWVLKDGLGRLGRLTVATRFGESFDSDLKRYRFASSLLYACALSLDYLTPIFPQHFLPMAALANIGKSVGLATYISTQPAFHKSFARSENLADISAKAQAQQMAIDTVGLACAVSLTALCRHKDAAARRALPLILFPFLVTGDLLSIYKELRSIHLRTLNKERAEILAHQWIENGTVLSPECVSKKERLVLPPRLSLGNLPLVFGGLEETLKNPCDVDRFMEERKRGKKRYALSMRMPQCILLNTKSECSSSSSSLGCCCCEDKREREEEGIEREKEMRRRKDEKKDVSSSLILHPPFLNKKSNAMIHTWNDIKKVLKESVPWASPSRACRGAIHAAMSVDAKAEDVLEVILKTAYLRKAIDVAVHTRRRGNNNTSNSSNDNSSSNGEEQKEEVRVRTEILLHESQRAAGSALHSFVRDVERAGWNVHPFMLSSAEKRFYSNF